VKNKADNRKKELEVLIRYIEEGLVKSEVIPAQGFTYLAEEYRKLDALDREVE